MAKCINFKSPSKTYATMANLNKALDKLEWLDDAEFLALTTEDGRFYPVFLASRLPPGTHPVWVAQCGFCVVN